MNSRRCVVLCALAAFAGCVEEMPPPIAEVPARHAPQKVMGRDFWHGYNKYSASDVQPIDNPEVANHPALADAVFCYVGRANPPPPESGLAVWPRIADYFPTNSPDREIVTSNPDPDRPFFLSKRGERNRQTWGSPIACDRADYARWRAAHPNLMADGGAEEWCNDLNGAWKSLAGVKGVYGDSRPDSSNRVAALKAFLGGQPKTRYEYLALLRRYYEMRKERNFGGTMSVLDAHLNSLHVAGDLGAAYLRYESTASGNYRYQPSAMFIRGAARQFGVPWEWYVAGYMNGPSKATGDFLGDAMCRYPQTPKSSGKPYCAPVTVSKSGRRSHIGCGGPEFGISRSLFKRTHYLAYLSGANVLMLEEWYNVVKMWGREERKVVFSPRGRIYADFIDFTRAHPDRGAHFSPVALCVPLAQGYPTWGGAPWGRGEFGYTAGDKAVDAVFYTLVPGSDYGEALKAGREQCLVNSPFANMYDVIAPDAQSQTPEQLLAVMKGYRALVVAGDYPDRSWEKALVRYEAEGGKVVRVGADMLGETVKTGKGRGIASGETRYPKLEQAFRELEEAYFPFEVRGDCLYGLTVSPGHCWLYMFNNAGITKFANAPEETDAAKASDIVVTLRGARRLCKVTELLGGKDVVVSDGTSFGCRLGPGELAIFEVK